ncbi:hypothetical protein RJP21_13765 [Paenibacillus sp. VCA1]|uniref:Uncharacterized protein n=2 Tax=Paenibacillus TaxID=44249 RepID=A0A920CAX4_9BACL|nr:MULTISPECIES: hypothetical protein [Paenibacillus]MDR9854677.1 hypothetical protein [Paenibacillus sp. VCA1]GIO29862.1 hypothetical protein J2TS6_10030 [Paenibacillus albilobatus]
MEKTTPQVSLPYQDEAGRITWQALLRHETLRIVKSGTFLQLISCPELAEMTTEYAGMNRHLLELLNGGAENS